MNTQREKKREIERKDRKLSLILVMNESVHILGLYTNSEPKHPKQSNELTEAKGVSYSTCRN